MKRIFIGILLACVCSAYAEEPMFAPDTEWNHVIKPAYGGGGPIAKRTYGIRDTVVNGITYQWVRWKLLRSEGAKVWCVVDSMGKQVERLLYDFDLQAGDSIRHVFERYDELQPIYYSKVTHVESITLPDGRSARRLSYDSRPDDIEHVGSVLGLLEIASFDVEINGTVENFVCCTRGDNVLYETEQDDCDKLKNMIFTETEHTLTEPFTATKFLRDGQLFINHNGNTYNAHGVRIRNF